MLLELLCQLIVASDTVRREFMKSAFDTYSKMQDALQSGFSEVAPRLPLQPAALGGIIRATMSELRPLTKIRIIGLLQAIKDQQVDILLIYASLDAFEKTVREVDPAIEQIFQRHMKAALDEGMPPAARALIDAIDGLTFELETEGWSVN